VAKKREQIRSDGDFTPCLSCTSPSAKNIPAIRSVYSEPTGLICIRFEHRLSVSKKLNLSPGNSLSGLVCHVALNLANL
jgi:hypothetical protein